LRIKELIIELNLDYNIILVCEIFLLNYLNWKIFLVSPTEIMYFILKSLSIEEEELEELMINAENYINFSLSEYQIFSRFDQFTIAISICKLLLQENSEKVKMCNQLVLLLYPDCTDVIETCIDSISSSLTDTDDEISNRCSCNKAGDSEIIV
jgi:hypothetical protein